jgi:hypothetical protein
VAVSFVSLREEKEGQEDIASGKWLPRMCEALGLVPG